MNYYFPSFHFLWWLLCMYVYVMAVGWFNKWSYDVAHQDGMSFAVLSYIYCCLLILM